MIDLKVYMGNDISCNSYLLVNNKEAIIIDPLIKSQKLISYLKDNKIVLKAILLTHGHYDHIKGVETLVKEFSCPVYAHFLEEEIINDKYHNGSVYFNDSYAYEGKINYLDDEIEIAGIKIDVIHTPFHTQGSVCFLIKDLYTLFTGDTLFKRSIGRHDLYSGDKRLIKDSLFKLEDLFNKCGNLKVYPGHGPTTSLDDELKFNPYFRLK